MQQRCLAGARGRDNQAAGAFAYRRHNVHDPGGVPIRHCFQKVTFGRVNAGQVVKFLQRGVLFQRLTINGLDLNQLRTALARRRGAAFNFEAGP